MNQFQKRVLGNRWQAALTLLVAGALIGPAIVLSQGVQNAGPTYTVLHSFTGADGAEPYAPVIRDSAGNLYGTTWIGGANDLGAVYKLTATGEEKVLFSFRGTDNGDNPWAGVVRDSAGNLYGTANHGSPVGTGSVYKLNSSGKLTMLHVFGPWNGTDGAWPQAGLLRDSAGNLIGTTWQGGGFPWCGAVYKVESSGTETVLHGFAGGAADGCYPYASPISSSGNLYGTTWHGGYGGDCCGGYGVVYKIDASNQETVLYKFTGGDDGSNPAAGVILDPAGNILSTTYYGGNSGCGVVFRLSTSGEETVLHSFTGGTDGCNPLAGVISLSGNLYGTTYYGGAYGYGVVYKVDASGKETVLHSFTGGADGGNPIAALINDSAGNLYGTAENGGANGAGVVFKLTP